MEETLRQLLPHLHWAILAAALAAALAVLSKSADILVDEAVALSERSGLPKSIIGATIVSLGTTTPEVAVSVAAALKGSPGLALGNAVGSVICDAGLILGLVSVMCPLKLDRKIVNRQGWVQLAAAVAIVAASFPWLTPGTVFSLGGHLSQLAGCAFLAALTAYLWVSSRWARDEIVEEELAEAHERDVAATIPAIVAKLLGALAAVVLSAQALIPIAIEAATRMGVPQSVIAGTVVAFGTSLPELVTAVTSARRGHGELALGTVIGADILNVLLVAGASAAVTPAGLAADAHFFLVLYPVMIFILTVFRLGIALSNDSLKRPFGILMLGAYCIYVALTFLVKSPQAGL